MKCGRTNRSGELRLPEPPPFDVTLPVRRARIPVCPSSAAVHEQPIATARCAHLRSIVATHSVRSTSHQKKSMFPRGFKMSLQRTKLATALGWAAGAAAAMSVCSADAQSAPDIRVEVTGSNIKRVEGEGALPVTVITRQEIERSGATTPMELLQQLSANNSAGMTTLSNGVGALTFSAQTASLRGLGGARTLVLINGNRIDSFSGEVQGVGGVNLAAIPFNAIERVEVLKDGASAIYGSDAIAGVINFITRNDYTGVDASGFYGTPTRGGGGDQWQGTVSAGWGDLTKDRWNAFLSASYNEQKPLDQAARNFSRSSYIPDIGLIGISSNTNPGNITSGGIGVVN